MMARGTIALILPAAGSGRRMQKDTPKAYLKLGTQTVLEHTIQAFSQVAGLGQVVIPTLSSYETETESMLQRLVPKCTGSVVRGGEERQHSIQNALKVLEPGIEWVMIHDAVRPFVQQADIENCLSDARRTGAAIVAVSVKDTIKQVGADRIILQTPERKTLWQAQTPQIFRRDWIEEAYHQIASENLLMTDDASVMEYTGRKVVITEGSRMNFKLTYPLDFEIAEQIINRKELP
ncbi:MAG: 2-C-methyl-D-erythritol 4-phosphate cytidylyltransferase [Balneolaceae bacterium]